MSTATYGLIILLVLALAQVFLSTRSSPCPGIIIPGINAMFSITVSLLFSDFLSALFGLVVTALPILLWLGIYRMCRRKLTQQQQREMRRMEINDL